MDRDVRLFGDRRMFVRPTPDMTKRADVDLGNNPQTWFSATLGIFGTQHPEVSGQQFATSLRFTRQDLVEGGATGTVTVSGGPHLLSFPAIVRNGRLAPFDLVFIDDKLRYADPSLVEAYASPYRPALGVASKDIPGAPDTSKALHIDKILPGMRTVMASVVVDPETANNEVKFAEVVRTMTDDQRERMLTWSMDHPDYWGTSTEAFKSAMTVLHNQSEPIDIKTASALVADWHDFALIRFKGINEYQVTLGKHAHSNFTTLNTDAPGVQKLAKAYGHADEDVLNRVDKMDALLGVPLCLYRGQNDPVKQAADSIAYELNNSMAHTASPGEIGSYGTYDVYFKDRGPQRALVLPVVDWDFKQTSTKLIIGDTTFAITERAYGRPASGSFMLPKSNINRGAWGAFVHESSERSFSTMPFEVIAIRDTPAGFAVTGMDIVTNTKLNLVKVHGIKSITKMDPKVDPGLYLHGHVNAYIPAAMEFVQLPMMNDATAPDPASVFKSASTAPHMMLSSGLAWIPEDALAKLGSVASDHVPLERILDTDMTLVAIAATGHYTSKLAHAVVSGVIESHVELTMPERIQTEEPVTKTASAEYDEATLAKLARELEGQIDYDAFMKIASATDDSRSLDTLLSINVLNDRNMKYFMDNIGILRDCETYLARLLLMARLAHVGVDEADLKAALDSLVGIKNTLSRLGMLREE